MKKIKHKNFFDLYSKLVYFDFENEIDSIFIEVVEKYMIQPKKINKPKRKNENV